MSSSLRSSEKQQGFTLIELMVVVVIMSVIISVTVLSLSPSEQARVTSQANKIKSYMSLVRDQSAFERKLYLVAPDQSGLTPYVMQQGRWQLAETLEKLSWLEGIQADWELDSSMAQKQQLPKAGWMFWPSGEVVSGEIHFNLGENFPPSRGTRAGEGATQDNQAFVSWNGILQFKEKP